MGELYPIEKRHRMREVYTIFYYPLDYGIAIVRDESLPVADKILSVSRECDALIGNSFTIYKYDRIFVVKHKIYLPCENGIYKEDLFLTVLTLNHRHLAIIDWIDLTCESVFILPSYFLNDFLESLIERYYVSGNKEKWFLSLALERLEEKEKRRFGWGNSYLSEIFKKEIQEIEENFKKRKKEILES
jgi:hypothetical protein